MSAQIKLSLWAIFLMVFGANAALVYFAINSERGLITSEPYAQALRTDEFKEELTRATDLGAKVILEQVNAHTWLELQVPVELKQINWRLVRPSDHLLDRSGSVINFAQAKIDLGSAIPSGLWLVSVDAMTIQGEKLLIEQRVIVGD